MKYLRHTALIMLPVFCSSLVLAQTSTEQQAEEKNIEETIVFGELSRFSAIKADTPIVETARSISIESEQDIKDKGFASLDQAYGYSAGVYGQTFGLDTRGDWVRVRGFDVPQFQDSLQSLFGNYNNARPNIYTLEQVEILKGPASVLYGKGSPGGLVNIISKRPKTEAQHEIVAELGSFNHKQLAFDSTGQIGESDFAYRVVALRRDSETQIDDTDSDSTVFAPSLSWSPSADTTVTVLANYTKSDTDPTAQFLPVLGTLLPASNGLTIDNNVNLGNPDFNQYIATTKSVTLIAEHALSDQWDLEFTARSTRGDVEYNQAWPAFVGGAGLPRFDYTAWPADPRAPGNLVPRSFFKDKSSSDQIAADVRLRGDFTTGIIEHQVLIGATHQDVTTDSDSAFLFGFGLNFTDPSMSNPTTWINPFNPTPTPNPPQSAFDAEFVDAPESSFVDNAIYISDVMSINNIKLSLGVRYDEVTTGINGTEQDDDAVSASAGILYKTTANVNPYFNIANSFDPIIGLNGTNGDTFKPQEGEQREIGLKYQPDALPAVISVAYFDIEQSNVRDPNTVRGAFDPQNLNVEVSGFELEANAQFGDVNVEFNASKLSAKNNENLPESVPSELVSSWISYKPTSQWQGFKSGLGLRYVGEDDFNTPSYTLIDAMVGFETHRFDIALNARNITDKSHFSTCLSRGDCFVGEDRNIVMRVKYKF